MYRQLRQWMLVILVTMSVSVPAAQAQPAPESFADLAAKLQPAVVNVSTTQKIKGRQMMEDFQFPDMPPGSGMEDFRDFFEQFAQPQQGPRGGRNRGKQKEITREAYSLGSGFVIDPQGYVVTNNHVIEGAEEIKVIFSNNEKFTAKVIGRDEKTDLALLKIDGKKPFPYVSFGDSDQSRVGDWVLAIGNPFGLGGTVTAGIISARARNINAGPFDDFIQTDAAINRGNSGGPMFNVKGEVIGINTAIFSPSGGSIGIGFAVPSSLAKPVLAQLREFGKTHRGWLGVKIQEVTDEIADSVGLAKSEGALVLEVTKGSPADKAGVKPGDIILSFDGKNVDQMRHLPRIVADTKIGSKAPMVVWRTGKKIDLSVGVGEMAEEKSAKKEDKDNDDKPEPANTKEALGMSLTPLTTELRDQLGLGKEVNGLMVVDVDPESEAAQRDLRYGDVITQVGDTPVKNIEEFNKAIAALKTGGRKFALMRITRGDDSLFVTLPAEVKK